LPGSPRLSESDVQNILEYYAVLLTKDPAEPRTTEDASIDELIECLSPENAVERIMYRREVSTAITKSFV
jgi:hypothetical protein